MSEQGSNVSTPGMIQPRLQYGDRRRPRSGPGNVPPAISAWPASGLSDQPNAMPMSLSQRGLPGSTGSPA
jgi:hypothetical protein